MTPPERVTVIIPTFERPQYLADALRSVLTQSYAVHQIIVVDDGSTDERRHEAERLAALSDRIEFHALAAHRGASAARNLGLDLARGDYVLFLDDDDLLEPGMVAASLSALRANSALDAVVCHHRLFCTPGGVPPFRPTAATARAIEKRPFSTFLRSFVPINACLVRRAAIGTLRFPEDLVHGEDLYFWLALCRKGIRFTVLRQVQALVRRHGSNLTNSRTAQRRQIRTLYRRLLAERMIEHRDDYVLVRLKLAYFEWKSGSRAYMPELAHACRHPVHMVRELVAVAARANGNPRGFINHYLLK